MYRVRDVYLPTQEMQHLMRRLAGEQGHPMRNVKIVRGCCYKIHLAKPLIYIAGEPINPRSLIFPPPSLEYLLLRWYDT